MPAPANLVHETSSTTGTGNFTVAAVNGKQRFSTAFGTGVSTNVFDYFISNRDAAEWERGTGHMSNANTLVRDTVIESTNSNNAVNFSAGIKDVSNDVPAASQYRVGGTDVAVTDGGTGASDASGARTNLGLVIGTNVQAYDADLAALAALSGTNTIYYRSAANTWTAVTIGGLLSFSGGTLNVGDAELTALAGLTSAADKLPYFTGAGTASLADFTSFARNLLDDANAAAMRATLDLDVNYLNQGLDLSDLNSAKAARSNIGLEQLTANGDANTSITSSVRIVSQNSITVSREITLPLASTCNAGHIIFFVDTGGSLTAARTLTLKNNATDGGATVAVLNSAGAWIALMCDGSTGWYPLTKTLGISQGGTGATSASAARTSLGLAIGTDVQVWDANLDALRGGTLGAWKVVYTNGSNAMTGLTVGAAGTALCGNGTTSAPSWQSVLQPGVTATITIGYSLTPYNAGTKSSGTYTPAPADGNYQYATNNGAHTLAAPSSDCAIDILYTNGASAGTITFSGFTVASGNTGDALTTTNTHKFIISIRRINGTSTYFIKALQ